MAEMGGNVEGKKGKATRHGWRFVLASELASLHRDPCSHRVERDEPAFGWLNHKNTSRRLVFLWFCDPVTVRVFEGVFDTLSICSLTLFRSYRTEGKMRHLRQCRGGA